MKATAGIGGVALLGLIQGLTEFLPVSSSGHLVLGQHVLALAPPSLLLDVLLHLGTLVPIMWLYRRDVAEMVLSLRHLPHARKRWQTDAALRLTVCVVVGTVPTVAMGLGLHSVFERLFSSPLAVAVALALTGGILMLTRVKRSAPAGSRPTLTLGRAFAVGVAQGCAITPGISRSGTTIAVGLLSGVERELAARFSFVLAIPAILGATVLQLRDTTVDPALMGIYGLGAAVAAASGYLALRWVVHLVRRGDLHWFAYYLWPLSAAVLVHQLVS